MNSGTLAAQIQPQKSTFPLLKTALPKTAVSILLSLMLAALSFFGARCTVLTYCSPFALALCCAPERRWMPAAVLGAAAGYLTAGYESVPPRYLAALILAVAARRIFRESVNDLPLFSGTVAFVCCALTGIVTSLMLDEVQTTLLPYTAESFLAGGAAVFWAGGVQSIKHMRTRAMLKDNEGACLLIAAVLLLLTLSYIKIYAFSPAKFLAYVLILLAAYYGKLGGGALAGISVGIAFAFTGEENTAFAGFCIGGLLAGAGAAHSKLLSVLALEAGIAAPLLFTIGEGADLLPFLHAAAAAVVFLLLPKKLLSRLHFYTQCAHSGSENSVKVHAASKLHLASDALRNVSASVYELKNKTDTANTYKKTAVYMNTFHGCCERCGLKYYCWEREKAHTVSVFRQIEKRLENGEELSVETLPDNFGQSCIRAKVLLKRFTAEHSAYTAARLAGGRAQAMREMMRVQFEALSDLLFELSEGIEQTEYLEEDLTEALAELLEYCGVAYQSAGVYSNEQYILRVELRVARHEPVLEQEAFLEDLEQICSRQFEPAECTAYDNSYKISYYQTPALEIVCAGYSLSAEQSGTCGDVYEVFKTADGSCGAVLADGMGKGMPAHINAALSARTLAKLLGAGFSPASAIRLINTALIVKDNEESFSSLDSVLIDRFSGKARFYKAGATASFVKRKNRIEKIELASMPIGILENADFAKSSLTLGAGDMVLLVSDGVTQGDCNWLGSLLLEENFTTPLSLAKAVCEKAATLHYGAHRDDISALAIFLRESGKET